LSAYCCNGICPHAAIMCVLILPCVCPHTAMCVSSYCYMYVLILLHMCPRTAICVSSYSSSATRSRKCAPPPSTRVC
jgi:hypothetical protein